MRRQIGLRALALAIVAACHVSHPRPVGAAWGTATPYHLVAVDPEGHWAVACQARADTNHDGWIADYFEMHGDIYGDDMTAYLFDQAGRETAIDDVIGKDPTGRWLAVSSHGAPILFDMRRGTRQAIAGELPHFNLATGRHVWHFDPTGTRLLFFRDGHPIVRELATGVETRLPIAAWEAQWSADGEWVELDELAGDTNHDGYVHGPEQMPIEAGPWENCGTHFNWGGGVEDLGIDFNAYGLLDDAARQKIDDMVQHPDELHHQLWRVRDGALIDAIAGLDRDTVLVRAADGALWVGPAGERGTLLAPASCTAAIEATYRRSILYTCRVDDGNVSLEWYRDGAHTTLAARTDREALDKGWVGERAMMIRFGNDHGNEILDMSTGHVIARGMVDPIWSDADRVLVVTSTHTTVPTYVEHDAFELRWNDGRSRTLPTAEDIGSVEVVGRFMTYGAVRVDLQTGDAIRLATPPIAIRADGAVLIDGGEPRVGPVQVVQDHRGLRLGPLQWGQVTAP